MEKRIGRQTNTERLEEMHNLWSDIYEINQTNTRQFKAEIVDCCSELVQKLSGIENLIATKHSQHADEPDHAHDLSLHLKIITNDTSNILAQQQQLESRMNDCTQQAMLCGRVIVILGAVMSAFNIFMIYHFFVT